MGSKTALLKLDGMQVRSGVIQAVGDVSFRVACGEIVALIGANGADKSTILNTLSGVIRPAGGSAVFDGLDLAAARSGSGATPQRDPEVRKAYLGG